MEFKPVLDSDLPEPYEPKWPELEKATSDEPFAQAFGSLLFEGGKLLEIVANLKPNDTTDRNQAVLMGHLVRMTKIIRVILRDLANRDVEQQLSISREFLETAANLKWLLEDDGTGARYDAYIEDGLNAERLMMEKVSSHIKSQGGRVMPVEARMQLGIKPIIKAAGIKDINSIRSRKTIRNSSGLPSIEKRVEGLGEITYFTYRTASTETHGTWADIVQYHINFDGKEYSPNFNKPPVSAHVVSGMAYVLWLVIPSYLNLKVNKDMVDKFIPRFQAIDTKRAKLIELREEAITRDDKRKSKDQEAPTV